MRGQPAGPLDRLLACVEEAAISIWRRRPFVAATVGAIGVTLTFPALAVVVLGWSAGFVDSLAAGDRVRVFIRPHADPTAVEEVRRTLAAVPGVGAIEHVTPDRARQVFARRFPELQGLVADLSADDLAFPESLEVQVAGEGGAAAVRQRVLDLPAVEDVRHDERWSAGLARVRGALRTSGTVIALLALAVTAFGIGNVIRINALSRREELAIMRLVGAPGFHLRVPFVLEGLVQGACGGLLAAGLVGLATWGLHRHVAALLPTASAGLSHRAVVVLIVAPMLAGVLGAAFAMEGVLRRHARLER